jgi:hypothetical protein
MLTHSSITAIPGDEVLKDDSRDHLNIVFVGHVDAGLCACTGDYFLVLACLLCCEVLVILARVLFGLLNRSSCDWPWI